MSSTLRPEVRRACSSRLTCLSGGCYNVKEHKEHEREPNYSNGDESEVFGKSK